MFAVKGLYQGGNTIRIDDSSVSVNGPYEVVVAFLQPFGGQAAAEQNAEQERSKKRAGFQRFMKYYKTLPADFDCKKELAEYRDERYGRPD